MSVARRVGGLLAGALVAAFLVWGVAGGWSKAASYQWEIDWVRLSLAVVVLVAFFLAWAVGYVALLEILAARRLPRLRFGSVWARSLLGRYVPGNILMFAGRVVLGREAGVPGRVSLAASVYEQVAMLAVSACAAATFLVAWGGDDWSPLFWAVLAVPIGLALLDPAVIGRASNALLARLGRPATLIPLTRMQVFAVLAWFGLTMALLAVGTGLGVRAVAGSEAGSTGLIGLGFLLAWVVSMLAFVFPSGLGVREGAFAVVLAEHLPAPAAVSLAAASRLILTAVELAVVGALVALDRRQRAIGRANGGSRDAPRGSRGAVQPGA
jgi:glycosyltransferase 2 family protein